MNKTSLRLSALALGGFSLVCAAAETVAPVVVTATRYQYNDTDAPYASEVHGAGEIADSGATDLYDFLSQDTSVTVLPYAGNGFAQLIDMRGFGIGSGYQNIVVTVDGRRMNNIDLVPQLLSTIPLGTVDRIEITKGSGSVLYGDGATAGAIHIYTRDTTGVDTTLSAGNYGRTTASVNAGATGEKASITVSAESDRQGGFSAKDTTGHRDEGQNDTAHALLRIYPTDRLEFRLGGDRSRIDTRYPGALTETQFDADPAQNSGGAYTHQTYTDDILTAGLTADLTGGFRLTFDHSDENKVSNFITYSSRYDYDSSSNDLALHYDHGGLALVAGLQDFDGSRRSSGDTTHKDNSAGYLQGHYRFGDTTLALGGRSGKVKYRYAPASGSALNASHTLDAWDAGINRRISSRLSLFANWNTAYQAPDIDRFFTTDWFTHVTSFNGFIVPARSRTLNVGLNHVTADNKLKLTLFHTAMRNEIYLNPTTYSNTNIDRSHKYGLDLEETHRFADKLTASALYSYTRAVIDDEPSGSGNFKGKELPGVPHHTLTVSADYRPTGRSKVVVSHTYRSAAYPSDDFANDFAGKLRAYNSTDLNYTYRMAKVELFAAVQNLFTHRNGSWVIYSGTLYAYPVNFTRNWRVGVKARF